MGFIDYYCNKILNNTVVTEAYFENYPSLIIMLSGDMNMPYPFSTLLTCSSRVCPGFSNVFHCQPSSRILLLLIHHQWSEGTNTKYNASRCSCKTEKGVYIEVSSLLCEAENGDYEGYLTHRYQVLYLLRPQIARWGYRRYTHDHLSIGQRP